jgi:hypothetical protein
MGPDTDLETMNELALAREQVRLQREQVALEAERAAARKPKARITAGFVTALGAGLGALIPLMVALAGGYVTLSTARTTTDAEIRQKFAELALTDVRGPSDVVLRARVLGALQPAYRAELEAAFGSESTGTIFLSGNAAKLFVFEELSAKVGCAEQLAALWGQLFGPTGTATGWEDKIKLPTCPAPAASPTGAATSNEGSPAP